MIDLGLLSPVLASDAVDPKAVGDAVMHHITDGTVIDLFGLVHVPIPEPMLEWGITKLVVYQWVCAAGVVAFFLWVARKRTAGTPTGLYNAVEAILLGVKAQIADPLLGEHDSPKWMPFLWTVFFVIFANNALGLIPMGGSSTAHLKVTGTYALMTLALVHLVALSHGPVGYFHALVPSVPWWMWPLMFVLEQFGYVAKAIALAVRLFANMVAGHLVFLTILSFILMFGEIAAIVVLPACVGLYLMEIFVAVLQAFVFTFLTTVFIGGVLHPDH